MSGHSKWSSIKHKKGAADAKRGQLFSKLTRAIIVAARDGGPDPDANATLATAIQKARDNSMPKENIERAIARGSGSATEGESLLDRHLRGLRRRRRRRLRRGADRQPKPYGGRGEAHFAKHDGNLGTSGAVAWLFERKGVVIVPGTVDEDELMLVAADGGADDVELDGSSYQVIAAPEELPTVRAALDAAGIPFESADLTMLPKTTVAIDDETTAKKLLRLMDALEENDDVQAVYANFDIPEGILEAVAA